MTRGWDGCDGDGLVEYRHNPVRFHRATWDKRRYKERNRKTEWDNEMVDSERSEREKTASSRLSSSIAFANAFHAGQNKVYRRWLDGCKSFSFRNSCGSSKVAKLKSNSWCVSSRKNPNPWVIDHHIPSSGSLLSSLRCCSLLFLHFILPFHYQLATTIIGRWVTSYNVLQSKMAITVF